MELVRVVAVAVSARADMIEYLLHAMCTHDLLPQLVFGVAPYWMLVAGGVEGRGVEWPRAGRTVRLFALFRSRHKNMCSRYDSDDVTACTCSTTPRVA